MLDASFAATGSHLAGIFEEKRRLCAERLVEKLAGIFEAHPAVVTRDGRPLVAPIDAQFFKGRVWFGLPAGSVRDPIVRRDPRASASYTEESFAPIVHGTARRLEEDTPFAAEYDDFVKGCYVAQYGPGWLRFHDELQARTPSGEGFTGWIEPTKSFAKN